VLVAIGGVSYLVFRTLRHFRKRSQI